MMGSSVHLHLNVQGADAVVIVPTLELNTELAYGQVLHLAFNPDSLHLFDKQTELSLL